MHDSSHVNLHTGYEWWLMKEARAVEMARADSRRRRGILTLSSMVWPGRSHPGWAMVVAVPSNSLNSPLAIWWNGWQGRSRSMGRLAWSE